MAKRKKQTAKDHVQQAVEKVKKKKPAEEPIKEEPKKKKVSKPEKKKIVLEEFPEPRKESKQTLTHIVEETIEHQDEEQEPELEQLLPEYVAKPPEQQESAEYQHSQQQQEKYEMPGAAPQSREEAYHGKSKDDMYQHANVQAYRSKKADKKEHDPAKAHDPLSELIENYSK